LDGVIFYETFVIKWMSKKQNTNMFVWYKTLLGAKSFLKG